MSNVHLDFIEDGNGDLVDILYYHHFCSPPELKDWPNPEALDYPVYCHKCGNRIEEISLTKEGAIAYRNQLEVEILNMELQEIEKKRQRLVDLGIFDA